MAPVRLYFKSLLAVGLCCLSISARDRKVPVAKVIIEAGAPGCAVDLDASVAGTTGADGRLLLPQIEPGDHYVHVQCPGKPEVAYFITAKVNEETHLGPASENPANNDPVARADNQMQLRKLMQQALELRAQAHLGEAVAALRDAVKLDPENSALHQELGLTFSMAKDWKRARVEMLETLRHDQSNADAHNGLGYALDKLGDIAGAAKEYRLASQLEPDDATFRTHYFEALAKLQAVKQERK